MKRLALLASAATLITSAAFAADLPSRKVAPVAPVAPAFTWTGFYAGVNAGVDWSSRNVSPLWIAPTSPAEAAIFNQASPSPYGNSRVGFIGGAQVGYNYQINQFVIGAEADFMGASIGKRSGDSKTTSVPIVGQNVSVNFTSASSTEVNQNWLGTVRLRAGYAMDRVLVYATGGLAYGNANISQSASITTQVGPTTSLTLPFAGSKDTTKAGYTVGAGLEYAMTSNWIIRGEYLYYNLGDASALAMNSTQPLLTSRAKTTIDGNIVRAAISYKF